MTKKKVPEFESAGILTLKGMDTMTKRGRTAIAKWLRARADDVEEHGADLAGTFRARYLVPRR